MRSWMFLHLRDCSSLRTVTRVIKLINSLLMSSFRRSDQYHNRLLLNKKMMNPFSHIQRCSDRFWWKNDFWISALSSHVHLLNVSSINILLFDTRNISSSRNSGDSDWFETKSSYDSVCQWRTFRWLSSLFDKWLLTISSHWSDRLVNH
jgi:hypothetical protein